MQFSPLRMWSLYLDRPRLLLHWLKLAQAASLCTLSKARMGKAGSEAGRWTMHALPIDVRWGQQVGKKPIVRVLGPLQGESAATGCLREQAHSGSVCLL